MTRRDPGRDGGRRRLRLQTQLLALLLAFGAVPVAAALAVGYAVGRAALLHQAEDALQELASRQAEYLGNEVRRQELLLSTITGQISAAARRVPAADFASLLASSLADEGVFDGLRLVDDTGRIVASVALGGRIPRWPDRVPAGPWRPETPGRRLIVHRDGASVIAYLLAAPAAIGGRTWWLEGHVRSEDFTRLFNLPEHLMGGAELGVLDAQGRAIVVPHRHALELLRAIPRGSVPALSRGSPGGTRSINYVTDVPETPWILSVSLPLRVVLAPVVRLRNLALFGGAALVLLILGAARLAASVVTTPLRELSVAASQLAETGSYEGIRHRGVAETEALVESFNRMANSLQRSRDQIDQLHSREMERAQQLATVGELASGVAHEIRNPLTGVLGALELARRRMPVDDPAAPMLREADAQLRRIETTTTRLLEYARPPELRRIPVDVRHVVERAVHVVATRAEAAGVGIRTAVPDEALPVHADPELLVQVLVNLMLNGIEAMPDGGKLTVGARARDGMAEMVVRDTGLGVPTEGRVDIFRPFFTTKSRGTGLGLSITQQIIESHEGTLRLDQTTGAGSTFVVTLPRLTTEEGQHE